MRSSTSSSVTCKFSARAMASRTRVRLDPPFGARPEVVGQLFFAQPIDFQVIFSRQPLPARLNSNSLHHLLDFLVDHDLGNVDRGRVRDPLDQRGPPAPRPRQRPRLLRARRRASARSSSSVSKSPTSLASSSSRSGTTRTLISCRRTTNLAGFPAKSSRASSGNVDFDFPLFARLHADELLGETGNERLGRSLPPARRVPRRRGRARRRCSRQSR